MAGREGPLHRFATHLVAIAVLLLAGVSGALAEKRVALVIGNSAYTNIAPLKNPGRDAALMADTLEQIGFKVMRLIDGDNRTMKEAMRDFGRELRESGAVGLFYYAGHGVQVAGENYLLPVNANVRDETEVEFEAINVNAFLQTMKRAASRINIVILDACRDNPFASSSRSASRGLARVDAPRGTYIAYATSPGHVALDGSSGNSPYTNALAQAMKVQGMTIEEVFKAARRAVLAATQEKQIPWETSSITGDFYFSGSARDAASASAAAVSIPSAAPATDTRALELAFWKSIEDSTSAAAYKAYLDKYPQGAFAPLARIKLDELTKTAANSRALAPEGDAGPQKDPGFELTFWQSIEDSKNVSEFESYLKAFPQGKFRDLATLRIEQLKAPPPAAPKAKPQPIPQQHKSAPQRPPGGTCRDGNMGHCRVACAKGFQQACQRLQRGF